MALISQPGLRLAAAIDESRLWALLMHVAAIGGLTNGGVDRQALTLGDTQAKNAVAAWATARGFNVLQDEAANLFVRLAGTDPDAEPVLIGSHLDTQPTGGKFDGAYGVIAGLEILDAIAREGLNPRRSIEVVSWMNEEGSRFLPGATGSSSFAATRHLAAMTAGVTSDGRPIAEELAASIVATRAQMRPMSALAPFAYLEAHIEQGPVLEREGCPVGIVEGIQGVRRIAIEIAGETAHAGTTPHAMRKDALVAATRIMQALHPLTQGEDDILRLTFGRIEVSPNVANTVPHRVRLTIDLRHPEQAEIEAVTRQIAAAVESRAVPCAARVEVISSVAPVAFDPGLMALLDEAASGLGIRHRQITSGAGHDALHLARRCPTAMVFVPCRNGVSHHESESAEPSDLAAGTRVLAMAAWELANR